jgi:hypothetical protein
MQSEGRKNGVVDSVVFAGNAKQSFDLHGFALSTETPVGNQDTLLTTVRLEPLTSVQSDATAEAGNRKLHVPVSTAE